MTERDESIALPPVVGPGTTLNGMFVIDEWLAAGGMGEVYRGRNIATGDPVAIKVVLGELAKDDTIMGLFFKEAKVLNALHHPAIVRYSVFGIDPVIKRPYLVTEYVDGPSLADVVDGKPMSASDARLLLARLAAALDTAHKAGVIHRDISPDNVILAGGKVTGATIIDFGIARAANVGTGTLLGGKFAGKYNFVSPEQLGLFGGEVTEVSDVYSLALLTVNALRGEPVDMNGTLLEVVEKRRSVPDLSNIDPDLRPLLGQMLQPNPADRVCMADITDWLRAGDTAQGAFPASAPPNGSGIATTWQSAGDARPAGGGERTVLATSVESPQTSRLQPERIVSAPTALADAFASSQTGVSDEAATPFARPGHDPLDDIRIEPGPGTAEPPVTHTERSGQTGRSPLLLLAFIGLLLMAGAIGALYALNYFGNANQQLAEGTGVGTDTDTGPAIEMPPVTVPTTPGPRPITTPDPAPMTPSTSVASAPPEAPTVKPVAPTPEPIRPGPPPSESAETKPATPPVLLPPIAEPPGPPPGSANVTAAKPEPPSVIPLAPEANVKARDTLDADMPSLPPPPTKAQPPSDVAVLNPPEDTNPPGVSPGDNAIVDELRSPKPGAVIDERLAWLRAFDAGGCFFAHVLTSSPDSMRIEGLATSADPLEKLDADFTREFGFAPDIQGRLISNMQCGVAAFLRSLSRIKQPSVSIALENDQLKNGDALKGELHNLTKKNTVLYLIDNDGIVYSLDTLRQGDRFEIGRIAQSEDAPMPQLVLTLSSDKPIPGSLLTEPAKNALLFQQLNEAITAERLDVDYGLAFFMLGGS